MIGLRASCISSSSSAVYTGVLEARRRSPDAISRPLRARHVIAYAPPSAQRPAPFCDKCAAGNRVAWLAKEESATPDVCTSGGAPVQTSYTQNLGTSSELHVDVVARWAVHVRWDSGTEWV